jgi:hypothetical protein
VSLNVAGILDAIVSDAMALGVFERVNTNEPKSHPGFGLSCAVWLQELKPVPAASGLNSTSVLLVFDVRIYADMLQDPMDAIDPNMLAAADALMAAYSAGFTLNGTVRNVDLLGQWGTPLELQAGYVNINQKLMRVVTLSLPIVVNDLWPQSA